MRQRFALLVLIALGLGLILPVPARAATPQLTVTLTPETSTTEVGAAVTLVATVTLTDDSGAIRAPGWTVRFGSSAGWVTKPIATDAAGQARYSYSRTSEGTSPIGISGASGSVSSGVRGTSTVAS